MHNFVKTESPEASKASHICIILILISSCTIARYLRFSPPPLFRILISGLSFLSYSYLTRWHDKLRKVDKYAILGFSFVISLVLILGYHITINGSTYSGTLEENYISNYSIADIFSFFVMLPGLFVLFSAAFLLVSKLNIIGKHGFDNEYHFKRQLVVWLSLFALWLPYLLVYWPGFIMSDTVVSINISLAPPRSNLHPILYSAYIQACISLGENLFGSRTLGYGLYTITQMLYVSFCISYVINWIWRHGRLGSIIAFCTIALVGLSPHFAAFSVAGWKDPIFSASIAALTVYLLNDALHPSKKGILSYAAFFFLLMAIAFFRNNGIGVLVFVAFWQLVSPFIIKFAGKIDVYQLKRSLLSPISCLSFVSVITYFIITGPIYDELKVYDDPRESNALVMQQLARVSALGGEMSLWEQDYLTTFLPSDFCKDAYRPCCVDLLKWDENLNPELFSSPIKSVWLTLMLKNPRIYFEAWELNSFGFWTLNVPVINSASTNLAGGVIHNDPTAGSTQKAFEYKNLLSNDKFTEIFVTDEWFIPIAWIFWTIIFLFICICLKGQPQILCALIPSLGLMLPLLVFTPINYWIRYAFALHYLLPVYFMLFCIDPNAKDIESLER